MASRTALILFTLTPRADASRKWQGGGRSVTPAERFVAELIDHTLDVLIQSGAGDPIICSPEGGAEFGAGTRRVPQRGATFGERFAAALEDVFSRGYERVLIAGNDCPGLTSGAVRAALALLEADSGSVVIGPVRDGGFYFLALSRESFEAVGSRRLSHQPWCGTGTLGAVEQLFESGGRRVVRYERAADLDSLADVKRWLHATRSAPAHVTARLRNLASALLRVPEISFPTTRSSAGLLAPQARPAAPRPPPAAA